MKKVVSCVLAIACLIALPVESMAIGVVAECEIELTNIYPTDDEVDNEIRSEQPALEAYYNMLDCFDQNFGEGNFPESYAGAYITNEKKLCILLTDDSPEVICEYNDYCKNSNVLVFENVVYNYEELENAYKNFDFDDEYLKVTSMSIDVVENCVNVGIDSRIKDIPFTVKNNQIYKYISEPMANGEATEIYGGSAVTGYTIGGCGYYNGKEAVVLCGHGLSDTSVLTLTSTGKVIADVVLQQCATDENYDYAVATIRANANVTTTNKVKNDVGYTTITSQSNRIPPRGSTVCMYGKNGNRFGVGEVKATSSMMHLGNYGIYCYGLVKCEWDEGKEAYSAGNSGGPIYAGHVFYGTYTGSNAERGEFWFSPIGAVPGFSIKTS